MYSIIADQVNFIDLAASGIYNADTTEIKAILSVYNDIIISSSRTNIGYLEFASMMQSIFKVILCFQHNRIPKLQNITTFNSNIDHSKLKVSDHALPNNKNIIASVTALGASGMMVNLILEKNYFN